MKKTCMFLLFLFICSVIAYSDEIPKHRVIILTDIEADPDDTESLVRLLVYSNTMDLKGIIATTSVHQKGKVAPESITRLIEAYAKVQPNLEKHEKDFPTAENLMRLVKKGLPLYGMNGVGEDKDSEGSDWIIKVLEEEDERPLWICVWGGPNTLAQALYRISKNKSSQEVKKLISRLRVYTISDQDDSGIWIRKTFPDIFYIVSPGGYGSATWLSITIPVKGQDNECISTNWLAQNIQQKHGPLGALYPDVAYGMEGDTPSWLSLIPNGLNAPEHPDWGGWGGRYEYYQPNYATMDTKGFTGGVPVEPEPHAIWTNATDAYSPWIYNEYGKAVKSDTLKYSDNKVTLWRWREDFQNDFASRMDWCIMPYAEANHPPIPALVHAEELTAKSGETIELDATGSFDPDGDNISYLWFHYPEAGTYKNPVRFGGAENLKHLSFVAPKVDKKESMHFILKVTDKGSPRLSRYKRVIINVLPK